MSVPEQGIREAATLLGSGDEAGALHALHAALDAAGDDPAVRRNVHELATLGHGTSHGFHKIEWQQLLFDTDSHPTAA